VAHRDGVSTGHQGLIRPGSLRPCARPAARPRAGLLAQPDFLKLWGGLTISLLGVQVSAVALPLVAVGLGATPTQMGALGALRWLPYLLFGLVAGAVLDRSRRRPVLIATHLGRALLLATVPAAALAGGLRVEQLYAVAFGVGTLMVFSDGAYQSLLPALVPRERLVEGNSRFALSDALARVAGPGAGGALVQLLTAPLVVALDALAVAVDALLVGAIRAPEPPPPPRPQRAGLLSEVAEGVRWVFGSPLLRPIQLSSMSFIGANSVWTAVYVLFLSRQLGLTPATIGLIFAAAGPGALLGASLAGRAAARLGPGRPILVTYWLAGVSALAVPLAAAVPAAAVPLLVVGTFAANLCVTVGSVAELSLRQAVTPARLQGRMNTTMRSLNWGMVTVGSLLGGALGDRLGLPPTLLLGTLLALAAALPVTLSPVGRLRALPAA
jgi:predicted MFS family arabinose efflux permease